MRRLAMVAAVALAACEGCPPGPPDGGDAGVDGGDGGPGASAFTLFTLDGDAGEATYFAIASDPVRERIGVVYYTPRGTQIHPGVPDYDLRYLEWRSDGGVTPSETIRYVQNRVGLALAFSPTTGEPVAGYLGGAPGFDAGASFLWFQSDAVVGVRSAGVWTENAAAVTGADTNCESVFPGSGTISDRGLLVGLWPALVFDSAGTLYFGWRDAHDGQNDVQDWNGSDVEVASATQIGTWTRRCVAAGGGATTYAWGGHLRMALGPGGQPALVHDQERLTPDGPGSNVYFQKRNGNGSWTTAAQILQDSNTQTGAGFAWDSQEGFGVAAIERGTDDVLRYVHSLDGVTWSSPDSVFGAGSGGWYPSLAMDPIHHEPAIAFYVCSPHAGATESSCLASDDELRISQRIEGTWREVLVDSEGGYAPRIGFFASGKRFVVYRHPKSGVLKLAVER